MNPNGRPDSYHFWQPYTPQPHFTSHNHPGPRQPWEIPSPHTPFSPHDSDQSYAHLSSTDESTGDNQVSASLQASMGTMSLTMPGFGPEQHAQNQFGAGAQPRASGAIISGPSSFPPTATGHPTITPPALSSDYLTLSSGPSVYVAHPLQPHLLILDLNGTLLVRLPKQIQKQRVVRPRPYLRPFLRYLFDTDTQGWRPWSAMVWSSAQPHNVDDMVKRAFGSLRTELVAVWARDTLGLSQAQYHEKVQTTKDLDRVWSTFSSPGNARFSARNTILLDDSALKAHLQPYNHVPLLEYTFDHYKRDRKILLKPITPTNVPDQHLLAVVGILDAVAHQSNASGWIQAGGLLSGLAKPPKSLEKSDAWKAKTQALKEKMQIETQAASTRSGDSSTAPSSADAPISASTTSVPSSSLKREDELREQLRLSLKKRKAVPPPRVESSDSEAEVEALVSIPAEGKPESSTHRPSTSSIAVNGVWYEDSTNLAYWVKHGIEALARRGIEVDPGMSGEEEGGMDPAVSESTGPPSPPRPSGTFAADHGPTRPGRSLPPRPAWNPPHSPVVSGPDRPSTRSGSPSRSAESTKATPMAPPFKREDEGIQIPLSPIANQSSPLSSTANPDRDGVRRRSEDRNGNEHDPRQDRRRSRSTRGDRTDYYEPPPGRSYGSRGRWPGSPERSTYRPVDTYIPEDRSIDTERARNGRDYDDRDWRLRDDGYPPRHEDNRGYSRYSPPPRRSDSDIYRREGDRYHRLPQHRPHSPYEPGDDDDWTGERRQDPWDR